MKRKINLFIDLALLYLLLAPFNIGAQTYLKISGTILDKETKESVPYSTIQLMSLPDSTLIKGTTSDLDGKFILSTPALSSKKDYFLKISFIGYTKYIYKLVKPYKSQLGDIYLNASGVTLSETVITAKAPDAVIVGDTAQFNASAYRTPSGAMLEDLVKQLPGAEITPDGKLLIHGKEVKKIMIDGEEFFADNPQAALKNLPSEFIESLKAYEKQSDLARLTGVEDGQEQMVLDLSVKKNVKKGWTETLFGGLGNNDKYECGNSFNRFRDKSQFTLIGNINNTNNQGVEEIDNDLAKASSNDKGRVGVNTTKTVGFNWSTRSKTIRARANLQYNNVKHRDDNSHFSQNLMSNMNAFTNSVGSNNNKFNDIRANASLEMKIDSFTTVILRPNIRLNSSQRANNGIQNGFRDPYSYENDEDGDGIMQMNDRKSDFFSDNSSNNYAMMFQISRRFRKRGRSMALKIDYSKWNNDNDRENKSFTNYYSNNIIIRSDTITQKNDYKTDGNYYRAQFVYVEPLWRNFQIQMQYSYQHKVQNSNRGVYDWQWYDNNPNEGYFNTSTYLNGSNYFESTFDNQTINIGIKRGKKKFFYNFGVNIEPMTTKSQSHMLSDEEKDNITPVIKNNVINYSPNIYFRYYFSKQINLKFNYTGRYKQPNLWDMQPVEDKTNPLSLRRGNENLQSSYVSTFNLNYNNYNSKYKRNFMLWLNLETVKNNITQQTTYDDETGVRTTIPVNVNGNWRLHGGVSLNTPIFNKYFTIRSYTYGRGSRKYSYSYIDKESILGHIEDRCIRERLSLVYRNNYMELNASGDVLYTYNYNNVRNFRYEFMDYKYGFNQLLYLPWNIEIDNEMTYYLRSGYGKHDLGKERFIWNGQISKAFFKNKMLLLRFKIYDILKEDNAHFYTVNTSNINNSSFNVLGSYCMFHAILKLNVMGKKN